MVFKSIRRPAWEDVKKFFEIVIEFANCRISHCVLIAINLYDDNFPFRSENRLVCNRHV